MDRRLIPGLNPLAYVGVNPMTPPDLMIAPRPPSARDYKFISLGTIWLDSGTNNPPTAGDIYMLVNVVRNNAVWIKFVGGTGTIETLTGDAGGAVSPDLAGNINIVSGIVGATFDGNPATNTITLNSSGGGSLFQTLTPDAGGVVSPDATGTINLLGTAGAIVTTGTPNTVTISTGSSVATQYDADAGSAAPALGIIEIFGGTSIATSGAGNTLTIDAGADIANTYTTDAGNAMPALNVINILGGTGASTSGAGNTVTIDFTGSGGIDTGLFVTDAGTATAGSVTANTLQVLGDHGINTSGATDIVTVAMDNAITLGDLTSIAVGSNALSITSGDILFGGDINDPTKTFRIKFPNNNIISFFLNGVFLGENAGNLTMTPAVALFNIGIGPSSCSKITTGTQNICVGNGTLMNGTTAHNSVAIGYSALQNVTTGGHNIGIGPVALTSGGAPGLTTGEYNIAIGEAAGSNYTGAESNNILIGHNILGVVGESNVTKIGGIRGATTTNADAVAVLIDSANQLGTISSSIRFKDNVQDMGSESDNVLNLRPVTFEYKSHPGIKQYGLIAEEVQEHMPRLVVSDAEGLPETVKYHELPAILLNEIQKLVKRIEVLESKLNGKE